MDARTREILARQLPPDLLGEVLAQPTVQPRGDWVARSQAFALFEPVRSAAVYLRTSLARRKLAGGRDLAHYDLEGLLMEAIDRVVDVYGLGESITTEELGRKLAEFVEQMDRASGREADVDWCAQVAGEAVDVLLNRRRREEDIVEAPHCAYVHRHLVPGSAPWRRAYWFFLLEEANEGGRRVVRAREEAVMFTVRMLDFDLEEMGEVLEDLLERQMKRGNFGGACRTAEQGRQVASAYAAKIRAILDEARRQPLVMGYAACLAPTLDPARAHLADRARRERDLRGVVDRLRWQAESAAVNDALDTIERELDASARVYLALTQAIADAPREHQARRARAFAGRVAPGTYVDPLEGVLIPALRLPAEALAAAAPALVRRLMPPVRPRLFDLASVVARVLSPEPARRTVDPAAEGEAMRNLPHPDLPVEAAERLLRERAGEAPAGVWLSELLAAAGEDEPLATALALLVHEWQKRVGEQPGGTLELRIAERGPRRRRAGGAYDDVRVLFGRARDVAAPPPAPGPEAARAAR